MSVEVIVWGSIFYGNRKETVDYQNIGTHTAYPFFVSYPLGTLKLCLKGENIKWYYSAQEFGGFLQEEGSLWTLPAISTDRRESCQTKYSK